MNYDFTVTVPTNVFLKIAKDIKDALVQKLVDDKESCAELVEYKFLRVIDAMISERLNNGLCQLTKDQVDEIAELIKSQKKSEATRVLRAAAELSIPNAYAIISQYFNKAQGHLEFIKSFK